MKNKDKKSEMSYPGPERRRYPRIPFWYIVKYQVYQSSSKKGNILFNSQSKNISSGGILLETKRQYGTATLLEIELDVPVRRERHVYAKVIGRVIRSTCLEENKAYDTAIKFTSVPETYRKNILHLIDAFQ